MTDPFVLAAALDLDPTVRGLAIVITSVIILPGSVYLLLATNLGARVGFLLALTGFFGWLMVQGVIWTIYAQGNRGRDPQWVPQEIITGSLDESTVDPAREFPAGWTKLQAGDRILGDAQAAADAVLAKSAADAGGGHGAESGGGGDEEHHFEAPFDEPTDYVLVDAYRRGGDTWPLHSSRGPFHRAHHAIVRVQQAVEQQEVPGQAPPTPRADTSKPVTSVIMVRDQGNVRFPPFVLAVSSGLIFGVLVSILHRRDKEAMARRATAAA